MVVFEGLMVHKFPSFPQRVALSGERVMVRSVGNILNSLVES